ncbi:MAG: peptide deformylase [Puniceicoccaceae bacterium 5H]|nr:MAG: peptide deformylase [Puniceicoccaceae bacterium 5H]
MTLRVTRYGEPVLRQTGKRIERFDDELKQLAADMIETMRAEDGVGLAAQQIGRALLLFVVDVSMLPPEDLDYDLDGKRPPIELIMPMALVNAQVKILPGRTATGEEGCLSFPGVRGDVTRPLSVEVSYQDLDGAPHHLRASGWFARVLQHEFDHTQGVLFIDHFSSRQLRNAETKLKQLKRAARQRQKEETPENSSEQGA